MSAYTHHGECSTSDPCKRCFEFGETTERKRIIKLLEAHADDYLSTPEAVKRDLCEDWHNGITDAIALIKRESNGN